MRVHGGLRWRIAAITLGAALGPAGGGLVASPAQAVGLTSIPGTALIPAAAHAQPLTRARALAQAQAPALAQAQAPALAQAQAQAPALASAKAAVSARGDRPLRVFCDPDPTPDPDPPASTSLSAVETLKATVVSGTLTITVGSGDVDLGPAVLDSGNSELSTSPTDLLPVTVTDTRSNDPGYSVTAAASDFTSDSGATINAGNLGWQPRVVTQQANQAISAGPLVSPPETPLSPGDSGEIGLRVPQLLAQASAGRGRGTAELTAALLLHAPTSTPAGQYRATLTLTVI